jgi:hypothetical protein
LASGLAEDAANAPFASSERITQPPFDQIEEIAALARCPFRVRGAAQQCYVPMVGKLEIIFHKILWICRAEWRRAQGGYKCLIYHVLRSAIRRTRNE